MTFHDGQVFADRLMRGLSRIKLIESVHDVLHGGGLKRFEGRVRSRDALARL